MCVHMFVCYKRVCVCLLQRRFRIIYKSLSINVAFLFCLNCHTGKHRLRHYSSLSHAHTQPLAATAAHYRETNNILLITTLNTRSYCMLNVYIRYICSPIRQSIIFVIKLVYKCPFSRTVKNIKTFYKQHLQCSPFQRIFQHHKIPDNIIMCNYYIYI